MAFNLRQEAGNFVEALGMLFAPGARDTGVSEWIAGGPTTYTQAKASTDTSWAPDQVNMTQDPGGMYDSSGEQIGSSPNTQYVNNTTSGTTGGTTSSGGGDSRLDQLSKMGARNPVQENEYQQLMQQANGGQVRSEIESGFNNYFSELDKMSGLIPQTADTLRGDIMGQYQTQTGDLQRSQQAQMDKLSQNEQEVLQNKKTTLRDLASDLRNSLQAGQIYLGGMGAGSSSATGRYSEALTKAANKRNAGVMGQANQLLADINQKELDIKRTVDSELSNLDQWKNSQLNEVTRWMNEQKNQIAQLRATGQLEKGNALANLNMQIMQNAMNRLSQIDAQASQFKNSLRDWAMSRANTLGELKQNLAAMGSYQVPGFQVDPLSGNFRSAPQNVNNTPFGFGVSTDEDRMELF